MQDLEIPPAPRTLAWADIIAEDPQTWDIWEEVDFGAEQQTVEVCAVLGCEDTPRGALVDIRSHIPEVIGVPQLEVQPAHVIDGRHPGCIKDSGCPLDALHATWPPIRVVPVLGRRPGVNLHNQSYGMGGLRAVG